MSEFKTNESSSSNEDEDENNNNINKANIRLTGIGNSANISKISNDNLFRSDPNAKTSENPTNDNPIQNSNNNEVSNRLIILIENYNLICFKTKRINMKPK